MSFKLLDHTADVILRVDAPNFSELLANAGKGLFAAMLDVDKVQPVIQAYFTVSGRSEEELLYNFLEELLVYKDADALAFSRFDIDLHGLSANVTAHGEHIRREHEPRSDVKAISWHNFRVWRDDTGWHAEVLLDV